MHDHPIFGLCEADKMKLVSHTNPSLPDDALGVPAWEFGFDGTNADIIKKGMYRTLERGWGYLPRFEFRYKSSTHVLASRMAIIKLPDGPYVASYTIVLPSAILRLGRRETAVAMLVGQGMSSQQVADELSISLSSVQTYRQRVREKTGWSKAELISNSSLIFRCLSPDCGVG